MSCTLRFNGNGVHLLAVRLVRDSIMAVVLFVKFASTPIVIRVVLHFPKLEGLFQPLASEYVAVGGGGRLIVSYTE